MHVQVKVDISRCDMAQGSTRRNLKSTLGEFWGDVMSIFGEIIQLERVEIFV